MRLTGMLLMAILLLSTLIISDAHALGIKKKPELDEKAKAKKEELDKAKKEYDATIKDERKVNSEIVDLKRNLEKYQRDELTAEKEKKIAEDALDTAKTNYRHALDITVRNDDDIKKQRTAFDALKDAENKMVDAKKKYDDAKNKNQRAKNDLNSLQNRQEQMDDKIKDAMKKVNAAQISFRQSLIKNRFISIIISDVCLQTECAKYKDLLQFDTTVPSVSGKFVEKDGDMRRLKSNYQEYWHWYQQKNDWVIVTVDPDTHMMDMSALITIVPEFKYVDDVPQDRKPSIDNKGGNRFVQHNIRIDSKCQEALVSPDPLLIRKAIDYFVNDCDGEKPAVTDIIPLPKTPYHYSDSPHYQASKKIADAAKKCKVKCL